jgi:hypothetical protein
MPSLIPHLTKFEQLKLLNDLNYLNMGEIKAFCKKHSIPYSIWIETETGDRRKTQEDDRKGVILNRIRHYLKTGAILDATCFPAHVCRFDDLPKIIKPADKLFYGQYDKKSPSTIGILQALTGGEFKNGAIARILAREFWSKGIAPTYREFAQAWLKARNNHKQPNPEWAFLSDKSERRDTSHWKQLRITKAKHVMKILREIRHD